MALFQSSLFFRSNDFGWSETYGLDVASLSFARTQTQQLIATRKNLLGENAAIVWNRVYSADPNDAQTELFPVSFKDGTSTIAHGTVDRAYSALIVTLTILGNRAGLIYLRGLPDDMVTGSTSFPTGWNPSGPWNAAFSKFASALVNLQFGRIKVVRTNPGEQPPAYDLSFNLITDVKVKKCTRRATGRPIELPVGRR